MATRVQNSNNDSVRQLEGDVSISEKKRAFSKAARNSADGSSSSTESSTGGLVDIVSGAALLAQDYTDASDQPSPKVNANDYTSVDKIGDHVYTFQRKNDDNTYYVNSNKKNSALTDQLDLVYRARFNTDSNLAKTIRSYDHVPGRPATDHIVGDAGDIIIDDPNNGKARSGTKPDAIERNALMVGNDAMLYVDTQHRKHLVSATIARERFADDFAKALKTYLAEEPKLAPTDLELDNDEIAGFTTEKITSSGAVSYFYGLAKLTTTDGQSYMVSQAINPDLFKQAKEQVKAGAAAGDPAYLDAGLDRDTRNWLASKQNSGYEIAAAGDKTPGLGNIAFGRWTLGDYSSLSGMTTDTSNGEDVLKIKINDDRAVVVTDEGRRVAYSREYTPHAFAQLKRANAAWQTAKEYIDSDGYILRNGDDDVPVLEDGDHVRNINDSDGNAVDGIKRVELANGDKYMVLRSKTPEHYDNAVSFQTRQNSDSINDIYDAHDVAHADATNLMSAKTTQTDEDDKAKDVGTVYRDNLQASIDRVTSKQSGYHLKIHNQQWYQDHKKIIDTILENWGDWNGSDDIVSRKDLKRYADDKNRSQDEKDAIKFLLDDGPSDSLFEMLDNFHEGGKRDGKISNADIDSWQQIIGNRPITEDNPVFERKDSDDRSVDRDELIPEYTSDEIAKLREYADLVELQSHLNDGEFKFLSYITVARGGDRTHYASSYSHMKPADLRGLIQEEQVGQRIAELSQESAVQDISKTALDDAVGQLKDRDGLESQLKTTLIGKGANEYLKALDELSNNGYGTQAKQRLNNDLYALQQLNPDKADEARSYIAKHSAVVGLQKSMDEITQAYDNGEPIDDDQASRTAEEVARYGLTGFLYTAFGIHGVEGVKNWAALGNDNVHELNARTGQLVRNMSAEDRRNYIKARALYLTLKDSLKDLVKSGAHASDESRDYAWKDAFAKQVESAYSEVKTAMGDEPAPKQTREGFVASAKKGFEKLLDSKALFALSGFASLANAASRAGDGTATSTQETLSLVRSVLVAAGSAPYALETGGQLLDHFDRFRQSGQTKQMFGLDKELVDVSGFGTDDISRGATDVNRFQDALNDLDEARLQFDSGQITRDEAHDRIENARQTIHDIADDLHTDLETRSVLPEATKNRILQQLSDIANTARDTPTDVRVQDSLDNLRNRLGQKIDGFVDSKAVDDIQRQDFYSQQSRDSGSIINEAVSQATSDSARSSTSSFVSAQSDIFVDALEHLSDDAANNPNLSDATREDINNRIDSARRSAANLQTADGGNSRPAERAKNAQSMADDTDAIRPVFDATEATSANNPFSGFSQQIDIASERSQGIEAPTNSAVPDGLQPGHRVPQAPKPAAPDGNATSDASSIDNKQKDFLAKVGPSLKAFSYFTDFAGGVLDIVNGALGLSEPGKLNKASSSFTVASGSAFTAAGIGELAGTARLQQVLTGTLGRVLRGAGPVGLVAGVGLGIVGLILGIINDKKSADKEDKIRDQFETYADYDATDPDWGEHFNYVINSTYALQNNAESDLGEDPLYQEWFPNDMPAWEAQPEEYKEFTDIQRDKQAIDKRFFYLNEDDRKLNIHGKDFIDENKNAIDTLRDRWDDWKSLDGHDQSLSRDDVDKVLEQTSDGSDAHEAAELLSGNNANNFFRLLDTLYHGGSSDDRISDNDLRSWLLLTDQVEEAYPNENPFQRHDADDNLY